MKKKLAIICNILVIFFGLLGLYIAITKHLMKDFFLYYTNLSNIFAVISSIIYLFTINKKTRIGKTLRYVSSCCLLLTLLVVICILTPMLHANLFVGTYMPYYHLICPLISIISIIFFEDINTKPIYAIIPTVLYGFTTIILNIFKVIEGPYPFLKVRNQSILGSIIWIVIIFGLDYIICLCVYKLNKKNLN